MPVRFRHLERLTAALADTVTLDDTARVVLHELLEVDGVFRVGLALAQGGGRELRFVSSDHEALGPHWIRWCTIDALADVPLTRTLRNGQPVYLSEAELAHDYPVLATTNEKLGTRSLATIPLMVDDLCLGGLLISWSAPQSYGTEQRGFLAAFAAQVAQEVRRSMAYHVHRTVSEELQRSLLPHSLPDVEGLEFGAHYRPGGAHVDVGGDWYDVMPLPDGAVAVSLGDVMGKGVQAAVVMSEVRTAARAYVLLDPDPSTVLERLDRLVAATSSAEQVVTMVYGVVDAARTELTLAVAGHPPPLVVTSSGRPDTVEAQHGPALGLGAAGPWPSTTVPLDEATSVLLYSDGLVESRERDLFDGIEALREAVTSLGDRRRKARELSARVADLLVPAGAADDVTLLALAKAAPRVTAVQTFDGSTTAAGEARRFVEQVLTGWSCDEEVIERAKLCSSELVTNAVIHAGSETTVTVRSDGSYILLMVHDRGSHHRVAPAHVAPDTISGRGLTLVEAISSAWNVEQSTDGTLVWCELELDPSESDWDHLAS